VRGDHRRIRRQAIKIKVYLTGEKKQKDEGLKETPRKKKWDALRKGGSLAIRLNTRPAGEPARGKNLKKTWNETGGGT